MRSHVHLVLSYVVITFGLLLAGCSQDPLEALKAKSRDLEARDWRHLSGMPAPQVVLSQIGHPDPVMALARRCQALMTLHKLLEDPLFAPRSLGALPAQGEALKRDYDQFASKDLFNRFRQVARPYGDAKLAWRDACDGRKKPWAASKLEDREWIALLQEPARSIAKQQNDWYEQSVATFGNAKQTSYDQKKWRERLTITAIGAVILVTGLLMMRRGWRTMRALNKYEFENRSEGGVVGFVSHEEALKHQRQKVMANQFWFLGGGLVALVGATVFFVRWGG